MLFSRLQPRKLSVALTAPQVSRKLLSTSLKNDLQVHSARFLQIRGKDARKLVQGLCTNDTNQLKKFGDCIAASFLTVKGRILANAFVYNLSGRDDDCTETLLIETHQRVIEPLQKHLQMYKLRSKASIESADYSVFLCGETSPASSDIVSSNATLTTPDPRIPNFSRRLYSDVPNLDEGSSALADVYEKVTVLCGLPETTVSTNRILLESNLDLLNHVSFSKGCYVGQELTARTKYKGFVRKRVFPFLAVNHPAVVECFGPSLNDLPRDLLSRGQFDDLRQIAERLNTAATTWSSRRNSSSSKSSSSDNNNSSSNSSDQDVSNALSVGSKVVLDSDAGKSIGEVLHVDAAGTCGFALMNLATVAESGGRRLAATAAANSSDNNAGIVDSTISSSMVAIEVLTPWWLKGLDEKTGNVIM